MRFKIAKNNKDASKIIYRSNSLERSDLGSKIDAKEIWVIRIWI